MTQKEQLPPKRVSDFTSLMGFADRDLEERSMETLEDTEFQIEAFEHDFFYGREGKQECVTIVATDPITGEMFKTLSFSGVIADQLHKVGNDNTPVIAKLVKKGKSPRRYYSLE